MSEDGLALDTCGRYSPNTVLVQMVVMDVYDHLIGIFVHIIVKDPRPRSGISRLSKRFLYFEISHS